MNRPIRVFLSSTWQDLQPEREAIEKALHRMQDTAFAGMEYFGSRPDTPKEVSLAEVDHSEVYIGIFAHRYGSGITEAEYRRARKHGISCLIYLKDDNIPVIPAHMERDPAKAASLEALKQELKQQHTVSSFQSPDHLASQIVADLHNLLASMAQVKEGDVASLGPKYQITVTDSQGVVIGDGARVSQQFGPTLHQEPKPNAAIRATTSELPPHDMADTENGLQTHTPSSEDSAGIGTTGPLRTAGTEPKPGIPDAEDILTDTGSPKKRAVESGGQPSIPSRAGGERSLLDKGAVQGAVLGAVVLLVIAIAAIVLRQQSIDSPGAVLLGVGAILVVALLVALFSRLSPHLRARREPLHIPSDHDAVSSKGSDAPERFPKDQIRVQVKKVLEEHALVDHDRLFGVDELLDDVKRHLLDPNASWIISLFGEGGIGKTALAYEAVKRFAAEAHFPRVAWVSTKKGHFSIYTEDPDDQDVTLQWTDLIKEMAGQLHLDLGYSQTSWADDFRRGLRQLSEREKCLIVVDNLETLADARVIEYFDDPSRPALRLVSPHKVIVTTRRSVSGKTPSVVQLPLTGLSPYTAYEFMRYLGRANRQIERATDDELSPVLDITEGNPFLIKLTIQRFLKAQKPLGEVLQDLRNVNSLGLGASVKKHLYVESLHVLTQAVGEDTAHQLMNAFCPLPAGEPLSYEGLLKSSGISDRESFEKARELACELALIRVSGSASKSLYSIHSLLWEFTCGVS